MEKFQVLDRDISWLSFNERVLQEATDKRVPLIERVRFLGIFSNNLDEFFRVRVATLKRLTLLDEKAQRDLDFAPQKTIKKILKTVINQQRNFEKIFQLLFKELENEGIYHLNENQLNKEQGDFARNYFKKHIRQTLVPIMLDKKSKFPELKDKAIYLAIKLTKKTNTQKFEYALIEVPSQVVPRFIILPEKNPKKTSIIFLEDIIRYCLDDIFSIFEYDTYYANVVKLTRDQELDIDDDISASLIDKVQKGLKKRKSGQPVRFIYDSKIPKDVLNFFLKKLKIANSGNLIPGGRYHNFKDFMKFPSVGDPSLVYENLQHFSAPEFKDAKSMLNTIAQQDVLISYPYESFNSIIELLREAAIDPKVISIEINLYRVGAKSRIINALVNAAKNGKQVTTVVELQARFDEENNIKLSRKLQEEGVKVIFGVPGLKVHSKLILIKRRVKRNSVQLFAHVGTGNFHENNAKIYTDHSLLTADDRITYEVEKVFEFFRKNYERANFKHLLVSPFNARNRTIDLIQDEIKNAKKGLPSGIILKLNNLVDEELIRKLYQASRAGVKIQLIVRGICTLIPGIKGMSENIEAISIVDRFLEHGRVMVFHANGKQLVFISSADWMSRNLDRRIEVATPIFDEAIKKELLELLHIQLSGNVKVRILDRILSNAYRPAAGKKMVHSQMEIYNYYKQKAQK